MANHTGVLLSQIAQEFDLTVAYQAADYEHIRLTVEDVSRPGLPLAGFFDHFEPMRLQVLGKVEHTFLEKLSSAERETVFDRLLSYKIPALLIARGIPPLPECLAMAQKHDVTVLCSADSTSAVISGLITSLSSALAPTITRHGVLVEVYGEGLLLMGESGLGKSEAAVELLKRGHRLVADDLVEIRRLSPVALVGRAPATLQNYIELRGIGVVDVSLLFGMGAVREENPINLIINLVPWSSHQIYDRLGIEKHYTELLGVEVPDITLPVAAGRNLAVILEVAAMNNRQKRMGHNAAETFVGNINRKFEEESHY